MGGIIANNGGVLLRAGSVADHIHLLLSHPRTMSPADLVQGIKTSSSKWLKQQDKGLAEFHGQGGYGMFSISPGHRAAVERYIAGQAEHHRKVSFQEEYPRMLSKYGVERDERYVWD